MINNHTLKEKVFKGSLWLYALEGFSTVILLIQTVILARLLSPEHFGIVGIFLIYSAALESFTKTGFSKALIQRENIDSDYLNTAWTVSIIRGFILFVIILLFSNQVVEFFNTPRALPVIRVLGFNLLLQGFCNPGTVYFSKDLNFFKQFLFKGSGVLANCLISIPLAFILRNEWAIVWGMLASGFSITILSYFLHPYKPRFKFELEIFKKLFNFGKWLFLSSIIMFFSKQGDKIIITKLLGESLLGIYVIAWRIGRMPELLTNPLPNVLFPAYSKLQGNIKVLKQKYLDSLRIITLFSIPFVGLMIIFAKPFIFIFLGEKWLPAVLPTQILTFAVGLSVLFHTSLSLFNAMGKTSFNFMINFSSLLTMSIFIYPLVTNYGVIGAALCFLIISVVNLIVWKIEISKLIGFNIRDLNCILFPIINTVFVIIVISFLSHWVNTYNLGVFISTIVFGAVVYFSMAFIISRVTKFNYFQDILMIKQLIKKIIK